jgi:hypothetical protein
MRITLILKLMMFSILGLPILLSTFSIGNEQNQIFAISKDGNTTDITEKPEITISDINGTKLLVSEIEPEPCWITIEPDGTLTCGPWPDFTALHDTTLVMNMTMIGPNGQEITFKDIQIKCVPSAEPTKFSTYCVPN